VQELPPTLILDLGHPQDAAAAVCPESTAVLVLAGSVDEGWAADAVIELVSAWSRGGRRLVLADLHLESPRLHIALGVPNLEGVVDIFLYGASVARIARPVRDGDFLLIPAGTYTLDAEEVYRHPRWPKVAAGFRDADATLVVFVPAVLADLDAHCRWADEAILLGAPPSEEFQERLRQADVRILGVLGPAGETGQVGVDARVEAAVPPSPPEQAPPPPPPPSPVLRGLDLELELPPPPVRRRPGRDRASIALWILLAVVLLGTAWFLIVSLRSGGAGAEGGDRASRSGGAEPAGAVAEAAGEPLPYSVQVTAYPTLQAARAELSAPRPGLERVPFLISPEEIQGVLYYRILAGYAADSTAATLLRDSLVGSNQIDAGDAAGTWSLLQFTPLAFDLGDYPTEWAARERSDSLMVQQIPSYVVAMPYSDGSWRWRVYGGAYRDSVSASGMRSMLEAAGLPTRLTARTGVPATLPE